ncbi:MAG: hypothetical protein ACKO3B_08365 [Bacteroidota bacterium]
MLIQTYDFAINVRLTDDRMLSTKEEQWDVYKNQKKLNVHGD